MNSKAEGDSVLLTAFLEKKLSLVRELDSLATAVMKVPSVSDLGGKYRLLIERVKEAWKAAESVQRENEKLMKRNEALRQDKRLPWMYTVYSALHHASSHPRPPVTSRDLAKIKMAAGFIGSDLAFCLSNLEVALRQNEYSAK